MGRAHEVRAASMAKTAAIKTKIYSRFGKEIYMAAKAGVPDPDMNQGLKRKIAEAKANQVPADVIKRAIEKAKGSSNDNYDPVRYEGFGPGSSTIVIDCLTDNVNRTVSSIKTCFNKAHAKLGVAGCVSHGYDTYASFTFSYTDDEKMLEALIENDVEVIDIEVDDDLMSIYAAPSDFAKAQKAIEDLLGEVKYDQCEIALYAQETTTLSDPDDLELWNRLLSLLDDVEDVQQVYHNVK